MDCNFGSQKRKSDTDFGLDIDQLLQGNVEQKILNEKPEHFENFDYPIQVNNENQNTMNLRQENSVINQEINGNIYKPLMNTNANTIPTLPFREMQQTSQKDAQLAYTISGQKTQLSPPSGIKHISSLGPPPGFEDGGVSKHVPKSENQQHIMYVGMTRSPAVTNLHEP